MGALDTLNFRPNGYRHNKNFPGNPWNFSLLGADSYSSCSPPCFFACVWAWGVKQSYFRDVTENQGGRSASRLVVGVWREGGILNRI